MTDRDVFLAFFVDEIKNELEHLKEILDDPDGELNTLDDNEKESVYDMVYDILETYTHSIMVMFDNGTSLSDNFLIDVINYDTKKSLTEDYDAELHEDFIGLMFDNFDET